MVVVFPGRGAENVSGSFAAVPLLRRGAGPPRCLSWARAAAFRHAPRRHMCLEAIVNVARSLRKRHGPKQGASCWPKNGAANCQARLAALTASHPLVGPRCGGRARVRICAHACIRAQSTRARSSARGSSAGRDEDIWTEDVTERKNPLPRGRRRQPPEAAPTRKGRHFLAQQRRRKLSSPTVGPDML